MIVLFGGTISSFKDLKLCSSYIALFICFETLFFFPTIINFIESVKTMSILERKNNYKWLMRRNTKSLRESQKSRFLCLYKETQDLPSYLSELDSGIFCLLNSRNSHNKKKALIWYTWKMTAWWPSNLVLDEMSDLYLQTWGISRYLINGSKEVKWVAVRKVV